jgi:transcriptional regulator with GAF, ATPase, and Fis domain
MLERALAFTEKLLAENARLRKALAASHAGTVAGRSDAPGSEARVRELEAELGRVRAELTQRLAGSAPEPGDARLARFEQELAEERRRYAELEEQNNNLANLYVASYQLHSTLDFKEVVAIVMEIVINLIGAESFCLMLVDGKTDQLHAIACEGMEASAAPRLAVGEGVVGTVAKTGEAWFRPATQAPGDDPLAAIPLKIKDHVIGVIVVSKLFPQKRGFSATDHELFNLLAGHAATAIFSAKLYGESERKLTTIQGFLDLLTAS